MDLLTAVCSKTETDIFTDLKEALDEGLLIKLEGDAKFVHDRISEAAHSLFSQMAPFILYSAVHIYAQSINCSRKSGRSPTECVPRQSPFVNQFLRSKQTVFPHDHLTGLTDNSVFQKYQPVFRHCLHFSGPPRPLPRLPRSHVQCFASVR